MTNDLQTGRKGMSMQEAEDAVVRFFAQVERVHKDMLGYYEVFKQVMNTGMEKGWRRDGEGMTICTGHACETVRYFWIFKAS